MITQSSVPFISDAAGPGQILEAPSRASPRIVTTDPNGPAPGNEHLGDLGNAVAFARHHADHLRYCWPWKKWLYWTGRKWTTDESGHVYQLAKDVIRAMYQAAVDESDDATRKAKVKHVLATESRKARIDAMIDLARSELVIQPDQLDNYMMHLNVGNGLLALGILDKPTDVFLPHNQYEIFCRDEFCMAIAPVWYKPAAACPTWLKFLDTIFSGNVRVINFVQELAGYALTGDVREQVLPIFYGSGANGKSTFVNTLLAILGEDYAIPGPRDLLMARKGDSHPTNVARLFRKRLVVWQETTDGNRLDEAFVKELTGGDRLNARRMCEDPWSFTPTHKAILVTNHKPEIRGTDHGIWRRVRLVPFNVRIPDEQQDKELPEKLLEEHSGILNWCLEGCRRWLTQGLSLPAEVKAATEEYRDQQDLIALFLDECCLTGSDDYRVKASVLFTAWGKWCEQNNETIGTQRKFGDTLTGRGFKKKVSNGIWRLGITLAGHDNQNAQNDQNDRNDEIPE